jgi:hypothetical protein
MRRFVALQEPPRLAVFLGGVLLGALAVGLLWAVQALVEGPGRVVDLGPLDAYPTDTTDWPPVLWARDDFYFVLTEEGEPRALYAYSAFAQLHDRPGCSVSWFASLPPTDWMDIFRDPCSGSTFSRDGTRLFGPSSRNLDQFHIEVKDGRIVVDTRRLLCDGPGPCRRLR